MKKTKTFAFSPVDAPVDKLGNPTLPLALAIIFDAKTQSEISIQWSAIVYRPGPMIQFEIPAGYTKKTIDVFICPHEKLIDWSSKNPDRVEQLKSLRKYRDEAFRKQVQNFLGIGEEQEIENGS